jgi:hypothetical protein
MKNTESPVPLLLLLIQIVWQNWLNTVNSAQEQMVSDKSVKENLFNSDIHVAQLKSK